MANIGENLKQLRYEEKTTHVVTKILDLIPLWDLHMTEVMREIVRIYDDMVNSPGYGHDVSWGTGVKMDDAFRSLIEEIIMEEEEMTE